MLSLPPTTWKNPSRGSRYGFHATHIRGIVGPRSGPQLGLAYLTESFHSGFLCAQVMTCPRGLLHVFVWINSCLPVPVEMGAVVVVCFFCNDCPTGRKRCGPILLQRHSLWCGVTCSPVCADVLHLEGFGFVPLPVACSRVMMKKK